MIFIFLPSDTDRCSAASQSNPQQTHEKTMYVFSCACKISRMASPERLNADIQCRGINAVHCTVYDAVHLSLQAVSAVQPQLMKMNVFNFAGVISSRRLAGFYLHSSIFCLICLYSIFSNITKTSAASSLSASVCSSLGGLASGSK